VWAGCRNVPWSFGADSFTVEMLACFGDLGVARVLVACDADEVGKRA
jgi:hypothetical protein